MNKQTSDLSDRLRKECDLSYNHAAGMLNNTAKNLMIEAADRIVELEETLEGVVEMLFEVGGCDKSVVDIQTILSKPSKDI